MKANLKVEQPEAIEMTLTITMRLGEWKSLSHQLQDHYPSWKLGEAIRAMTDKAQKHFQEDSELFQ